MSDNGESSKAQYSVSEDGETLTVYMPVDGTSVSSKLWRLMKKFKQVRIVKLSSKKADDDDDHEDDSDTSTLVDGENIDKSAFLHVVVMHFSTTTI